MKKYIQGNKEAWEEAFELKNETYGEDIAVKIRNKEYAFFYEDAIKVLKQYDFSGKSIGQFCCNNGRELLSLVKTTKAKEGIGFDIAENMVQYANGKAKELEVPCTFVAINVLDIDDSYRDRFDAVIITIGALCWFEDLNEYFKVVSKCLKNGGVIVIHEQHPFTNMLAMPGDDEYNQEFPLNCIYSYYSHKWINNEGMMYMTGKSYKSKTFTDFTHFISEIIGAMCHNHIVITGMQEFSYDISGGFSEISNRELPLSMIIEGKKNKKSKCGCSTK